MTKLSDVLAHVRDEGLSLAQLEAYRDSLIAIRTSLFVRKAELKKLRAFFLIHCEEKTLAAKNMSFDVTPEGQELLTVQGELSGISGEIDGLQSRIYGALRNHT